MERYSFEILEDVKKLIADNCDVSLALTTDIWMSRCMDSYISGTVHFINKHFRLHRRTPNCLMFDGSHTGDAIKDFLEDIVDKLAVSADIPMWGVADNASNMVKGLKHSTLDMYSCLNPTHQLAILDTFK